MRRRGLSHIDLQPARSTQAADLPGLAAGWRESTARVSIAVAGMLATARHGDFLALDRKNPQPAFVAVAAALRQFGS
jgi:hypothetical protein